MKTTLWLFAALALQLFPAMAVHASCDKSCLSVRALEGDGKAALEMATLSLKESSNFQRNHARMVYWYRIAAENGDRTGQWNYAQFLAGDSTTRAECVRALYWFKRAKDQGEPLAEDVVRTLTKELADKSRFLKGCSRAL